MQQCVWEGTLDYLPLRVTGDAVLMRFNRVVTPVATVRVSMRLYCDGLEVFVCDQCVRSHITSVMSFRALSIDHDGARGAKVAYDLEVQCSGNSVHASRLRHSLVVVVQDAK
jgi:hypothetical protein